jgi:hypothetical protein
MRIDGMEGLKEFRRPDAGWRWIVEEGRIREKGVMKDGGGEFFLEEDGEGPGGFPFVDMAGVGLVVIQDQELPRADGDILVADAIPFLPREDRFDGEAAYVLVTMALPAERVENDVLLPEAAEVRLFVESGGGMVGQLCKVHVVLKLSISAYSYSGAGSKLGEIRER